MEAPKHYIMKIIFLLALIATMCTAFGQGKTPAPPAPKLTDLINIEEPDEDLEIKDDDEFDVVKYVEDYIKKHMKEPTPKSEFETTYEWQERVRKEKYEQRKELMHKALDKLYSNTFWEKINLRMEQYDIEHGYFPMKTNGWGTYVLPADREDGPKWRASWEAKNKNFVIKVTYGLVNGKPRLVSLTAESLEYNLREQGIYPIDEETGKFTEFVWRNGNWEIGKKFTEFEWGSRGIWQPGKDLEEEEKYGNQIFREKVDQMPEFNGNMNRWLKDNLKYPVIAQENGVSGKVYVEFVVETNGSITDVKVVRSVDPSLDKEAVRVVKSMPKWKPGKIDGIPVRVAYIIPINFGLSN